MNFTHCRCISFNKLFSLNGEVSKKKKNLLKLLARAFLSVWPFPLAFNFRIPAYKITLFCNYVLELLGTCYFIVHNICHKWYFPYNLLTIYEYLTIKKNKK